MQTQHLHLSTPESSTVSGVSGCWKLAAGRAVTLRPRRPGTLRIAHGRVWATVDGPHAGHGNEQGDHVLGPGDSLTLKAGQRLVLEPWGTGPQAPAWFSWDYAMQGAGQALAGESRWAVGVAQPLSDLRLALALGAGAVVRLAFGVVGLLGLLGPAGLRALSAASRARRAQRAMRAGDSIALSGAV